MTVKELIQKLQELPDQEVEVRVLSFDTNVADTQLVTNIGKLMDGSILLD